MMDLLALDYNNTHIYVSGMFYTVFSELLKVHLKHLFYPIQPFFDDFLYKWTFFQNEHFLCDLYLNKKTIIKGIL